MSYETNENGYMLNPEQWTEEIGKELAAEEGVEMTDKHWDLVNFLRDEYVNNGGNQPNDRNMVKAMKAKWSGEKVDSKTLYMLFPKQPSKQAGKIAGLPESKRKGGY
jgi:tRNA 2-thiouridine synthesizing protein E